MRSATIEVPATWSLGYGSDLRGGTRSFCHECLYAKPLDCFTPSEHSDNGYCMYCTNCLWSVFHSTRPHLSFSKAQPDQFTYVILARTIWRVKIGRAKNPKDRLDKMQTGCPVKLELLEITADIPEEKFHENERLQQFRIQGEWYQLCDDFVEAFESIVQASAYDCNFADIDWDEYTAYC